MSVATTAALVDALDRALPQTQCTRCGYPDCRSYAVAIADGTAPINRCPPGGREGITRLARISGQAETPLDPACGVESPRLLAVIDEAWCIGCTLCLKACPVDCIVGGPKRMHTVIAAECTGCELCLPACPVDCIALVPAAGEATGWDAWSSAQADTARGRYAFHVTRLERDAAVGVAATDVAPLQTDSEPFNSESPPPPSKSDRIAAALARARAARGD